MARADGGGHGWLLWDAAVRYTRSKRWWPHYRRYPPNLAGKVLAIAYIAT